MIPVELAIVAMYLTTCSQDFIKVTFVPRANVNRSRRLPRL